ncbi:MAG: MerC domain-containing protein [Candidatus Vogelbacteria bacterium]|nr:MerC domain-containing protein [Candidatus Vogelbacteria bacterium]
MQSFFKKIFTMVAPILGAGAIGVCPLCWIGSASLLTYLGLGALIPVWRWLAFGLIAIGAIGFILDYRAHKNPKPLILLAVGATLLYVGRYVFLSTWGAWWIWGPGALLIIAAVIYNKSFFRKPKMQISTEK